MTATMLAETEAEVPGRPVGRPLDPDRDRHPRQRAGAAVGRARSTGTRTCPRRSAARTSRRAPPRTCSARWPAARSRSSHDTLAPQFEVAIDDVTAVARCTTDQRGLLGLDGVAPDLGDLRLDIRVSSSSPTGRGRGDARRLARALPDLPRAAQAALDRADDGRLADDHDVEHPRAVDALDPLELDVAGRRGAADPGQRPPGVEAHRGPRARSRRSGRRRTTHRWRSGSRLRARRPWLGPRVEDDGPRLGDPDRGVGDHGVDARRAGPWTAAARRARPRSPAPPRATRRDAASGTTSVVAPQPRRMPPPRPRARRRRCGGRSPGSRRRARRTAPRGRSRPAAPSRSRGARRPRPPAPAERGPDPAEHGLARLGHGCRSRASRLGRSVRATRPSPPAAERLARRLRRGRGPGARRRSRPGPGARRIRPWRASTRAPSAADPLGGRQPRRAARTSSRPRPSAPPPRDGAAAPAVLLHDRRRGGGRGSPGCRCGPGRPRSTRRTARTRRGATRSARRPGDVACRAAGA